MKRPKDEEPAIESKQKKKAKLPQPIKIPVGTVTPLRSSKELWVKTCLLISKLFNASICGLLVPFVIVFFLRPQDSEKSAEPPLNDVLDFLVNFSDKVTQAGLWTEEEEQAGSSTASSSKQSSANEIIPGVKAKARPPMPPGQSSSSPTMTMHVATPSHGSAKGLPLPVDEKYQKKQLVVNPYEMKKFLYGTAQMLPDEDCTDQRIMKV